MGHPLLILSARRECRSGQQQARNERAITTDTPPRCKRDRGKSEGGDGAAEEEAQARAYPQQGLASKEIREQGGGDGRLQRAAGRKDLEPRSFAEETILTTKRRGEGYTTAASRCSRVWAGRGRSKFHGQEAGAILSIRSACERSRPNSKTMLREVDFIAHNTKRVLWSSLGALLALTYADVC